MQKVIIYNAIITDFLVNLLFIFDNYKKIIAHSINMHTLNTDSIILYMFLIHLVWFSPGVGDNI
jgi:hypothetical protein